MSTPTEDNRAPEIIFDSKDRGGAWAGEIAPRAREAVRFAALRLGLAAPERVRVTTFGRQEDFQSYLGFRPREVIAVARAQTPGADGEIVILRPLYFAQTAGERGQTLAHEAAHLILGRRAKGRMPAWLNEGLAQLTARQGEWSMGMRLTFAGSFGGLIPLSELEESLLANDAQQALAYAESVSVTRFLIQRTFPQGEPGDPKPLARLIADPREGAKFLEHLWDATLRDSLEWQWKQSQKSVWNWIAAASGGGALWGFCTVLFLLAYWRKRRFAQQLRERFADEEERDRELGTEIPPWEYAGDEDEEGRPDEKM